MNHELRIPTEAERCIEDQLQWYEADEANGGAELADRWLDLPTAELVSSTRTPGGLAFNFSVTGSTFKRDFTDSASSLPVSKVVWENFEITNTPPADRRACC
jgi:hypothetical protein